MVKSMKKFIVILLLSFSAVSQAEVNVSWSEPENYRDIDATDESQSKFEKRVFKQFEEYFKELSKGLPTGQKLWIKVTDLDLAGRVLPGYAHGIDSNKQLRVIKRIDYPRIKFKYHVTDANGKVLSSNEVKLKDLGFQDGLQTRNKLRDNLRYEKDMIKDWFQKTFPREVAEK